MSVFRGDCPHCGTKSVAFAIRAEHRATKHIDRPWDTLAACGYCSRAVLASFEGSAAEPSQVLQTSARHDISRPTLFPAPRDTGAPIYTPENAANCYRQGMENLGRNWDAAGIMFRKALEVGLKVKFPSDRKEMLFDRIQRAAERHELTPELAEWAHQIRLGGRDAAHDEEPFSEEEAKRLQVFTELVFRYLFTLPRMVKEARGAETSPDERPAGGA